MALKNFLKLRIRVKDKEMSKCTIKSNIKIQMKTRFNKNWRILDVNTRK